MNMAVATRIWNLEQFTYNSKLVCKLMKKYLRFFPVWSEIIVVQEIVVLASIIITQRTYLLHKWTRELARLFAWRVWGQSTSTTALSTTQQTNGKPKGQRADDGTGTSSLSLRRLRIGLWVRTASILAEQTVRVNGVSLITYSSLQIALLLVWRSWTQELHYTQSS